MHKTLYTSYNINFLITYIDYSVYIIIICEL